MYLHFQPSDLLYCSVPRVTILAMLPVGFAVEFLGLDTLVSLPELDMLLSHTQGPTNAILKLALCINVVIVQDFRIPEIELLVHESR